MELNYSQSEEQFRDEVRTFLAANLPKDISYKVLNHLRLGKEEYVRWHKILAKKGWSVPGWPVEFGGTGWTPTQHHIFNEENALAGAPGVLPFGAAMLAPVLMRYGNDAQKKYYLPRILDCTDWWCQGYSEPESGSDLASLKMKAERDGDFYILNGQKTWTTLGQHANMIFCLVRTAQTERKQEGISFIMIDMNAPGISVRPLITLDEDHEVNEVFFENVKVPVENLVGEENKGWTYGKFLLGNERTAIANVGGSKREFAFLKTLASKQQKNGKPLTEDPLYAAKLANLEIDLMALEMTVMRVLSSESAQKGPGPEASLLKIKGTDIQQTLTELMVEAVGSNGLPFERDYLDGKVEETLDKDAAPLVPLYFNLRKTTIYGGSNEIQKNIIAQMILGL